MTFKSLIVTLLLCAVARSASAQRVAVAGGPPPAEPRLQRLEQWLTAALTHAPGDADRQAYDIGEWTTAELHDVYVDVTAVTRLLRNPRQAAFGAGFFLSMPAGPTRAPIPVRYTAAQTARLKQLACVVGTLLETTPCDWVEAVVNRDQALSALAGAAAGVKAGDTNIILRRGAILHSDIAMLGLATPRAPDLSSDAHVRMTISDGQQAGLMQPSLHWETARNLLDQVIAGGASSPSPGRDDMVRQWYLATTAWMQREGHHDNAHVDRGREIFPDDPTLALLIGAQHEVYASGPVQTAVRSAVLPTGITLAVASERIELREAERFLRRAIELKADLAEAHIRLGRVLSVTGRDAEAADRLLRGLNATDEPLLQYYASLFLGAVEEKLGRDEAAKQSYQRASLLFPSAQSPHFGLSELARRAGHRDEALEEMARVYALERPRGHESDPWWTYNYAHGRHADVLLDAMRKPFRARAEP